MIVSSQQQTDPVIACCATNTSQVLSMASKSDRLGINIDQKLDTILKQMVWQFIIDPEGMLLKPLIMCSHSKMTIPTRKLDPHILRTYCNLR